MVKIAIVSLNWNGYENLKYFLPSVSKVNYNNFFTVIVDNGSIDGSIRYIEDNFPNFELIKLEENKGYSKGFNIGIQRAIERGADYVLITNNDLELSPDILDEAIKLALTDEKIGYMSGKVYDISKRTIFQIAGGRIPLYDYNAPNRGYNELDKGQYDKVEDFEYMDDVFVLVSTKMVNEVGAYDEDFFFYYEETEWNYRIRNNDWRIVYNPKMKVWHRSHGSTAGSIYNSLVEYHRFRGEFLFNYKVRKNYLEMLKFSIIFFTLGLSFRLILLTIKSRPQLFKSTLRGSLSGLITMIQKDKKY